MKDHRQSISLTLPTPLRHLISHVVTVHVNFEVQKKEEEKEKSKALQFALSFFQLLLYLSSVYGSVKDIKIIMNMVIILLF